MNDEEIIFQPKTEAIYKIIVVGDPAVGKTSLLTKFSTQKFKSQYIPTVGVNITKEQKELSIGNKKVLVSLMIWDVAGQPQFYMLHKPYFNGADGMLLVFDTTRTSTFSNVKNWYSTTVKYGLSAIPRFLIGNKIDLKDERKISKEAHVALLSEELNTPYFETSALTCENVDLIFKEIATAVFQSNNP